MTGEIPTEQPKSPEISICGQTLDLELIFQNEKGEARIECPPDSGQFIKIVVTDKLVDIRPEEVSPFFFRAQINYDKALVLNAFLKQSDGARHPSMPYFHQIIPVVIHFLESKQKIEKLTATWLAGSDNFVQYNEKVGAMGTNAALHTQEGSSVAEKFGFIHILSITVDRNDEYIIVKFSRIPPGSRSTH